MFAWLPNLVANLTLDSWAGKALGGIVAAAAGAIFLWLWRKSSRYVYGTEEYQARIEAQIIADAAAKQDNEVVFSRDVGDTQLKLFSGDITRSSASVIVRSDDTLLSATGGVAKAIIGAAGSSVKRRLRAISSYNIQRGMVAITDGGRTRFRYILHAVVLTKASDHTEYPSKKEIALLLGRLITIADAMGADSVALPILAAGTAAKRLKEEGLATEQDVIRFIIATLVNVLEERRRQLRTVFVVAYSNKYLTDDFVRDLREPVAA